MNNEYPRNVEHAVELLANAMCTSASWFDKYGTMSKQAVTTTYLIALSTESSNQHTTRADKVASALLV